MHEATEQPAQESVVTIQYERISEDREGREAGVTRQREDNDQYCSVRVWEVAHRYRDNDIGASTRSKKVRPDFTKMLADVKAGRWGPKVRIVSWTTGRLTRRPRESEDLIELAEAGTIEIRTVKTGSDDLTTAYGRMVYRIKRDVDIAEAEVMAERIERGAQQRREQGQLHGGPRIFGYIHPTKENKLDYCRVIDEPAAKAIRDGIDMILNGRQLMQVADEWNKRGLKTTHGKEWRLPDSVRKALTSPRIAGYTAHEGKIVAKGDWPAIIDRATHDAIVEALTTDGSRSGRTARKYLLSGVVFCGGCGSKMRSQVGGDQNRYLCDKQRGGCGKVSRSRPWLESAVRGYVVGRIEEEHQGGDIEDGQMATLEAAIGAKDGEVARLRDAYQAGVFTLEEVSEKLVPLRAEIDRLMAERGKVTKIIAATDLSTAEALEIWLSDKPELFLQRRELLLRHVQRVMVKPLGRGPLWGIKVPIPVDSIAIVGVK